MSEFSFQIVTPEAIVFEANCIEVELPGSEGQFGVLAGHMNFVSSLIPGVVQVRLSGQDKILKFAISDGFADVTPEACVVLAEMACGTEGLDTEKTKKRITELHALLQNETQEREKGALETELSFLEHLLSL